MTTATTPMTIKAIAPKGERRAMHAHYSSGTYEWSTPQEFFDALHAEFGFTLDVCAKPANAKCPAFFAPEQDGLMQRWSGTCWMNPPYGRAIGQWVKKAHESAIAGATVVCLVPSRTDTAWWHDHVTKASEIRFVRKRLKFGGAKHGAPFPSAVVIFRPTAAFGLVFRGRLVDAVCRTPRTWSTAAAAQAFAMAQGEPWASECRVVTGPRFTESKP